MDSIDEMEALFGQEQFIINFQNPNKPIKEMNRVPNGAWIGRDGPIYTRVSGAWVFKNLCPWSITSRRNYLYMNPFAALPVPDYLKCFNHVIVQDGKYVWKDGTSLASHLKLDPHWPE
ncbi:hypothetical protein [Aestuariispira insulae]|uniref:hypothetical protein n=1 Tax=Aestuariispira insulae TaxID=1461337 RepID=UPI0011C02914|nr:hypothetical protein [Aestuariispira insulae]